MDTLSSGYNGLNEEYIRKMSHEELVDAVIRMFNVKDKNCEDYFGRCFLSDELADAFRGR